MIHTNFSPFPVLYTERFTLRPLRLEDDKELFILRTDKRINEFIDRKPPASLEDVRAFMNLIMDASNRGESILWAICANGEKTLSGTICLWKISPAEAKAEIGYELLHQHHGKGIMQEVIPQVVQFGFEKIGLRLIEAEFHRENVKSLKLLVRNGFTEDIDAKSDHPDLIIYKLKFDPS